MIQQISSEDLEFLVFVRQELTRLEETAFGFTDEATLREMTARIRHLVNRKSSTIKRLFDIFKQELLIAPEENRYFITLTDENSPACYEGEFTEELTEDSLGQFSEKHFRANTYVIAFPLIGFDRSRARFSEDCISLDNYLDMPIIGIENTLITRWQVITFLANKKGIPHHSSFRDKNWHLKLDKVWRWKTSSKNQDGSSNSIRSIYEVAQRIANEVLSIPQLKNIRKEIYDLEKLISMGSN